MSLSAEESEQLAKYMSILLPDVWEFVDGRMGAEEFDRRFFEKWPKLPGLPSDRVALAAEKLFQDAEDHVIGPQLRLEPAAISTEEFRKRARAFLRDNGLPRSSSHSLST